MAKKGMRLEDMTYEELVEHVTQRVHLALIEEGGKGMRRTIHLWLSQAILWSKAQENLGKKEV